MFIPQIARCLKAAISDSRALISRISEEKFQWDELEKKLKSKDYLIALIVISVVFLLMIGLIVCYKNKKILLGLVIYSCTLVGLLLLIFILFGVYRWSKPQKTKEYVVKCIKQIGKICALLGSVLFFFYRLFHSIFAFSPKRENTMVYMVTLVFLDLQGLLASLIVYEWHEHEILQFVSTTISANFDKYAISYGIFILICVELFGLINYCALAAMRKLEMYIARNQFKMNMKIEDIPANYMEPVERDLDYDWNYINNFCWLMILGLMVLLFAIAVFSPQTLFLENKDSQSAFINVVALVSLIILIFDKRSSWLLNRKE